MLKKFKNLNINIVALFISIFKKETPLKAKIMVILGIIYTLSPIDGVSDFIPFFGILDDLVIFPLVSTYAFKQVPVEVMKESQKNAKKIWYVGLLAIAIIILFLIYFVWRIVGLFK